MVLTFVLQLSNYVLVLGRRLKGICVLARVRYAAGVLATLSVYAEDFSLRLHIVLDQELTLFLGLLLKFVLQGLALLLLFLELLLYLFIVIILHVKEDFN